MPELAARHRRRERPPRRDEVDGDVFFSSPRRLALALSTSTRTRNRASTEQRARWNGCLPFVSTARSVFFASSSSDHVAAPCHRSNESNTSAGAETKTCASLGVSSGNSKDAASASVETSSSRATLSCSCSCLFHSGRKRRLTPGIHVLISSGSTPLTANSFSASSSLMASVCRSNAHSRRPPSRGRHTTSGDCHTCKVGSIAERATQTLMKRYAYLPRSGMARSVQPSFGRCGVLGLVHESGSRCRRVAKWIFELTTCPSGRRITQSMFWSVP